MEIERKWLFDMSKVPICLATRTVEYTQAYISIEPEVRIRSKKIVGGKENTTYMLCIKGNGTVSRIEVQKHLTKEEYDELMQVGNINPNDVIKKYYYVIDVDGYELTVGTVDVGTKDSFSYGEIEFNSEEEANVFVAPYWFGEDVTNKPEYKMKNYWKRTRLE